jgi:chorismate mutase/prephenate dehydrogenase
VFGLSLSRLGISLAETLRFLSPAYLMELYVAARHFAQDPHLYGPIQMLNPELAGVLAAFEDAMRQIGAAATAGDQAQFDEFFAEVRRFFGPFMQEAQERSGFMIDRLVERS